MVSQELDLNDAQARRLVTALLKAGYLQKVEQQSERSTFYERTLDGSTLASATMTAPLRRATVDRLLKDVVERARVINANDAYAYRVARIALFGSALGDAPRPGDVDLAVTLTRRYEDPVEQERVEWARRRVAQEGGRVFRGMDDLSWPETEVWLALRARSRGLAFVGGDKPAQLGAETKVIFDDSTKRSPNATARPLAASRGPKARTSSRRST
jgi:hypothetical protein